MIARTSMPSAAPQPAAWGPGCARFRLSQRSLHEVAEPMASAGHWYSRAAGACARWSDALFIANLQLSKVIEPRRARDGEMPGALNLVSWMPIVGVVLERALTARGMFVLRDLVL